MCRKLAFQGGAIRLSGAAAKTLDKESGHEGYYNGAFEAARKQQLTTNPIGGCILDSAIKRFQESPLEFL